MYICTCIIHIHTHVCIWKCVYLILFFNTYGMAFLLPYFIPLFFHLTMLYIVKAFLRQHIHMYLIHFRGVLYFLVWIHQNATYECASH